MSLDNVNKAMIVALVGNPNCGKTTLFNALTGLKKSVGNWAGVTVQKSRGRLKHSAMDIELIDLPGCYECIPTSQKDCAQDEYLACEYILSGEANLILNVVDATHLERHLYLSLQLLERGFPIVIALNMMDVAEQQGIVVNLEKLSEQLGCPVIPISAIKEQGIPILKDYLLAHQQNFQLKQPSSKPKNSQTLEIRDPAQRFQLIDQLLKLTVSKQKSIQSSMNWSEKIDNVILNRYLSLPLFLLFIYILFVITIDVGKFFQGYFEGASQYLFVDKLTEFLLSVSAPQWVIALLAEGIGQGIHTTVTFIPVIGLLYFCLAFLEGSGYMARAAFVMDKLMERVGLPGKSFVPLILGFGCNVPAILGARTLENHRERILTILMTPFMSCGARLAIFALFVSAFFPRYGALVIFSLYLIGICVALATGFFLQKTLLPGKRSPLVMELPPYRWPALKTLIRSTCFRVNRFILKAGALILPLCAVIGLVGAYKTDVDASRFAYWGKMITPIFAPMGITEENWPATVGLLTGVVAKEVVVGTLNALYLQEAVTETAEKNVNIAAPRKLERRTSNILGVMSQRFESIAAAFAYLLFVLLYFPCVSVIAVIGRELNRSWAAFTVIWTTGVAYGVAVIFYQLAMIQTQMLTSVCSISLIIGIGFGFFKALKFYIVRTIKPSSSKYKPLPTQIFIAD